MILISFKYIIAYISIKLKFHAQLYHFHNSKRKRESKEKDNKQIHKQFKITNIFRKKKKRKEYLIITGYEYLYKISNFRETFIQNLDAILEYDRKLCLNKDI